MVMIPYAYIRARSIVLPSGEVLGRQCRRLGKQFDDFRPQRVTAAFIPCNVYAKHWVSQLRRERGSKLVARECHTKSSFSLDQQFLPARWRLSEDRR